MLIELYDVLRAAGADEEKARKAAEAVAGHEATISGLRTEIRVVQAIGGVIIVLLLATFWQLFGLRGEVSTSRADVSTMRGKITTLRDDLAARLVAIERKLP